jgi:hypothetical protein
MSPLLEGWTEVGRLCASLLLATLLLVVLLLACRLAALATGHSVFLLIWDFNIPE